MPNSPNDAWIERTERAAFELVTQAIHDYREMAWTIFREETDKPADIAEDITREAIESMGVSSIKERLYGKVDYKKAIYVFTPQVQPVALMVDAKAEKEKGSITLQMSQTSMMVRFMHRNHGPVEEPGQLKTTIKRDGRRLHVVTIFVKYFYADEKERRLDRIILACVPNGRLQDRYNPSPKDTIWRAGRHSPKRGEDFRVRLAYPLLKKKAEWRVREIESL